MSPQSSPTHTAAVQGLVQRNNQVILDGTVAAVLSNGLLAIQTQGHEIQCWSVIDHIFQVGEPVMLTAADDGSFVVAGAGAAGTEGVGVLPGVPTPSPAIASQSLHDAVLRLVAKRNRILRRGVITAVLSDGTLGARLDKIGERLCLAATTQTFFVGQPIYAIALDDGSYRVLGTVPA